RREAAGGYTFAQIPDRRFVIGRFFPPAQSQAARSAGTCGTRNATATICFLCDAVDPYDEAHAHLGDPLAHAGPREKRAEALRVRRRGARLEPGIQRIDERVIGIDLERALAQMAARIDLITFALLVSNVGGDRSSNQLALQTVEEFLFRARTFQVRL